MANNKEVIVIGDSGVISRPERKDYIVPQGIVIGYHFYKDNGTLSNKEILKKVDIAIDEEKYVGTTCPAIVDYVNISKKYIPDCDILSLGMSSKISSGNSSSFLAASDVLNSKNMYFFDTLTGGVGGTLIDDYAVKLASEGKSVNQIIEELNKFRKMVETHYFVEKPLAYIRSKKYSITSENLKGTDKMIASALVSAKGFAIDAANFAFNRVIKDAKIPVVVDNGALVPIYKLYKGDVIETSKKWLNDTLSDKKLEDVDRSKVVFGGVAPDEEVISLYNKFLSDRFDEVSYVPITGSVATYGSENLMGVNFVRRR